MSPAPATILPISALEAARPRGASVVAAFAAPQAPAPSLADLSRQMSGVRLAGTGSRVADLLYQSILGNNPAEVVREVDPVGNYNPQHGIWWARDREVYNLTSEMLDRDSVIGATVETVLARILAREVRFVPKDDSERAQAIAFFVERALLGTSDSEFGWAHLVISLIRGALKDGLSIVETIWRVSSDGSRYVPASFKHCFPGQFTFNNDYKLQLLDPAEPRPVPVPWGKFTILRRPAAYSNPWGQSAIFPLRFHYWFRKQALVAMSEFAETYGNPFLVAKVDTKATDYKGVMERLEQNIAELRRNAGMVIPDDVTLTVENRGSAQGRTPHERIYKLLGQDMATHILGSVLSSQVAETATQATAKVHAETDRLRTGVLASLLGPAIKRGIVVPLVRLNFGADAPVPDVVIDFRNDLSPEEKADLLKRAYELDLEIPASQIRDVCMVNAPVDGEPVVRKSKEGEDIAGGAQVGDDPQSKVPAPDPNPGATIAEAAAADSFSAPRRFREDGPAPLSVQREVSLLDGAADAAAADYLDNALKPALKSAARAVRDFLAPEGSTLADLAGLDARLLFQWPGRAARDSGPARAEVEPFQRLVAASVLAADNSLARSFHDAGADAPEAAANAPGSLLFADAETEAFLAALKTLAGVEVRDAARWMLEREVTTVAEVERLALALAEFAPGTPEEIARQIRERALALAYSTAENQVRFVQRSITAAVNNGATTEDFLEEMDAAAAEGFVPGVSDAYAHNVFRTEAGNALRAEQERLFAIPSVQASLWGFEFFNPNDDRSRRSHARVDGVRVRLGSAAEAASQGGPPWAYQCRCVKAALVGGPDAYTETEGAEGIFRSLQRFAENGSKSFDRCPVCGAKEGSN